MSNEALDNLSFFVKVPFYLNFKATLMTREQEEVRKERGKGKLRKEGREDRVEKGR